MEKIMMCKEISYKQNNNETYYYKVPDELCKSVKQGDFIYVIHDHMEKRSVTIAQIKQIEEYISSDYKFELSMLSDNDKIYLVSEEYFLVPIKEEIQKYYTDSDKKLKNTLNILIKSLDLKMSDFRNEPLSEERKNYLIKMFYAEDEDQFNNMKEQKQTRWFKVFNDFELDFVHMINLYSLKETISKVIEMNKTLADKEKILIKEKYFNRLDIKMSSINLKGINRYKLNQEIGLDISDDYQNIIFGRLTKFEYYLNFFSFWNIIKSLLTVSFIPIVVVLLNSDKKIIIYAILGFVYLITTVLSDKKQTDNTIDFMNQIRWKMNKKASYGELFYIGVIVVLVFIFFSFQLIFLPNAVDSLKNILFYISCDILLAFTSVVLIIISMELLIYLISEISATIFFTEKIIKFSAYFWIFFKMAFWIVSDYCIYNLFEININAQTANWQLIVYVLASSLVIFNIKQNISEVIIKIRNRDARSYNI